MIEDASATAPPARRLASLALIAVASIGLLAPGRVGLRRYRSPPSRDDANGRHRMLKSRLHDPRTVELRQPAELDAFVQSDADAGGAPEPPRQTPLRLDWTDVPPTSPLARQMTEVQSRCSLRPGTAPRTFRHVDGGLGQNLHTWAQALCASLEGNAPLVTEAPWLWLDAERCAAEAGDSGFEVRPMLCYFGPGHLPEGRCGVDAVGAWPSRPISRFEVCPSVVNAGRTVGEFMTAAMEYLFQSVSPVVIREAERQAAQAFPDGLPDPEDLVTVHMRWGDKRTEVAIDPVESYIRGVLRVLESRKSSNPVHIYLASEDNDALNAFMSAASPHGWIIHTSGPTQVTKKEKKMMEFRSGPNGLSSMGALLLSMQSNYYVLATTSNWSRLINELRAGIVDPRCGGCTKFIDLHPGEWPNQHEDGSVTFDSYFGAPLDLSGNADTPVPHEQGETLLSPDTLVQEEQGAMTTEEAVAAYRERVVSTATRKQSCPSRVDPSAVDVNAALSCLHQTTPNLVLEYPPDADAHMNEIRMALAPWAQHGAHRMHSAAGHGGPWIENHWISRFEGAYDGSGDDVCLQDLFGPYVPIFMPWVDGLIGPPNENYYPDGLIDTLKSGT